MSLFQRLSSLLQANLNSAIDGASDPRKMLDVTLSDIEKELGKARGELLEQTGTAKRLAKKATEIREEALTWENRAVLALQKKDDDLARDALKMKKKLEAKADEQQSQSDHAGEAAAALTSAIAALDEKVGQLRAKKAGLAGQARVAAIDGMLSDAAPASSSARSLTALDALRNRIDLIEGAQEANAALGEQDEVALRAKFRALEKASAGGAVEDELAALKKRLSE